MSCVVCESYGVQLRPAVGVLVVLYSVRLAMDCVGECVLCLQVHRGSYWPDYLCIIIILTTLNYCYIALTIHSVNLIYIILGTALLVVSPLTGHSNTTSGMTIMP